MKIKLVYLFDEVTGEYLGQYEAHESPLEEGIFHTPIHSTEVPLPLEMTEGDVAVWSNGNWILKSEHRGETWYDENGNEIIITTIDIPAELVQNKPQIPVDRETLAAQARTERDNRINQVQWRYARIERQLRLGIAPEDDLAVLDKYVHELTEIPQQPGFPAGIHWPINPFKE